MYVPETASAMQMATSALLWFGSAASFLGIPCFQPDTPYMIAEQLVAQVSKETRPRHLRHLQQSEADFVMPDIDWNEPN